MDETQFDDPKSFARRLKDSARAAKSDIDAVFAAKKRAAFRVGNPEDLASRFNLGYDGRILDPNTAKRWYAGLHIPAVEYRARLAEILNEEWGWRHFGLRRGQATKGDVEAAQETRVYIELPPSLQINPDLRFLRPAVKEPIKAQIDVVNGLIEVLSNEKTPG
jgi:hypothetical protein